MAKLGWIGMGDIGTPMVLRLIDAGHEVTVWGRNKERLCPALEKGGYCRPITGRFGCLLRCRISVCHRQRRGRTDRICRRGDSLGPHCRKITCGRIQQFILNSAGSWRSACVLKGECAGWMRRFLAERAERSLVPYPFSRGERRQMWTAHALGWPPMDQTLLIWGPKVSDKQPNPVTRPYFSPRLPLGLKCWVMRTGSG